MSTSGPNPEDPVVYAKMATPKVAIDKLAQGAKLRYSETGELPDHLWLLRESTMNGCLTVSYIKLDENQRYSANHTRYILTSEGTSEERMLKWECISDLSAEQVKEQFIKTNKIVFINMNNIKKEEYLNIGRELFNTMKEKLQLSNSGYLKPSKQEGIRNEHYECISEAHAIGAKLEQCEQGSEEADRLIESAEKTMSKLGEKTEAECPITWDSIGNNKAVILGTRHLYNVNAANQWVASAGSDPLTRERITPESALQTNVCQNAKAASDQLKDVIKRKRKESHESDHSNKNSRSHKKPRI